MYSPHESKTGSALYESIVAKFGSRISLNFRPQTREIFFSPMGRFFDKSENINFGILYDGRTYALPFGNRHTDFQYIEQHETADRVIFVCKDFRIGVRCEISFISPFLPQDEQLCSLPALLCEIRASRLIERSVRADDHKDVALFCDARMSDFIEEENALKSVQEYVLSDDHIHYQDTVGWKDFLRQNPFTCNRFCGESVIVSTDGCEPDGKTLFVRGKISQRQELKARFVIAGYVGMPVLDIRGQNYRFSYTQNFSCAEEVAQYAVTHFDDLLARSERFLQVLEKSSLSPSFHRMFSFGFRSYAANTWFCRHGKKKWFSVWEGNCLFHSTVDVEYNIGVFYLLFWPELLEYEFESWPEAKKSGFLPHDIGGGLQVGRAAYLHEMQVEENCNFILLLSAYASMYAKTKQCRKYLSLVRELLLYNRSCDKTGNGMANEGTANTIDDSSDNVQFAQEQIYLGVKEYAAYIAAGKLAAEDEEIVRICREESDKIRSAIETCAWRGDHYAVNLVAAGDKLNEHSIYSSVGAIGDEKGKDAYSIYTANGLVYLFLAGFDFKWNRDRLFADLVNSFKKSKTPYGCTHSDVDKSNVWISQNIWRDIAGCYLGADMTDNADDYWQYEVYENQGGRGGCFIDTYGWNKLNYYPRGIAIAGILYAAGGISADGRKKAIRLAPCKVPLRIPIVHLADWKTGRVPVIDVCMRGAQVCYFVENEDLLRGYKICTELKRVEK